MYQPKHAKKEYTKIYSYDEIKRNLNDILNIFDRSDYVRLPKFFFYDLEYYFYISNIKKSRGNYED